MKIAILKDLHASGYRRDAWKAQFRECLAIAAEECHAIILAGDIFDSENVFDSRASTGDIAGDVISCIEWARRTYPGFPQIHAMVGNHDLPKGNALDALAVLEPSGVTVHRGKVARFKIHGEADDDSPRIVALNWSWDGTDPERELGLTEIPFGIGPVILLTHCDVIGARMNNGKVAEPGSKRWALSREFLAKISETVHVECAHYHGEQRISEHAWIGPAMIQGNFGHADEPQGFVILDTETRERRRVDVNEAAPHRKVFASTPESALAEAAMLTDDSGPTWIVTNGFELSQTDKATLAAAGIRSSAANLPVPTRVGRSVEIATDSRLTDPLEILRLYDAGQEEHLDAAEIEARAALVSSVLAGAQDVSPRVVAGAGSVTPIRATLRGIGPYIEQTSIDFSEMGRVVAVHGTNGVGKTIGIGSVFLALYNAIPGYNGNGFGMVTGANGVGSVILDFTFRGEAYTIVRSLKTGARNSQAVELRLPSGETITGAESVAAWVSANIGTGDAALATCWVSADRDNDICGATTTDGERRESFSQFLGFAWFDAVAKACGEAMREARAEESALAIRVTGAGDVDEKIDALREEADTARAHREQTERELVDARGRFNAVDGEARGVDVDDSVHRSTIAESERIDKTLAEQEKVRADLITRRSQAAQARLDASTIVNETLPEIARLESESARLEKQRAAFAARLAFEREERGLEREIEAAESKLRANTIALSPEDEELARREPELLGAGQERRAEITRVSEENRKIRDKQITKDSRIATIRRDIEAMERRVAARAPLPFGERCEASGCAFLAEQAGLPAALESLRVSIAEAEAVEIPPMLDVPEIDTLLAEYAKAKAAADRVAAAQAASRAAESLRLDVDRLKSSLELLRATAPEQTTDPSAELAGVSEQLRALIEIRGALPKIQAEAAKYDELAAASDQAEARFAELESESNRFRARAHDARLALEDSAKARAEMARRVETARAALTLAETENEAARETLSNAVATLSRHEDFAKEIAALRDQADAARLRAKRLEWARLAFGKEGVQPIIIDSAAAPELEARANALLRDVTGGAMELRIVTRELTDKGEIREVFRVEVRNGTAQFRSIALFSGGERERVQLVFRAALALFLAARIGAACESIVVDEAFNKLSPENVPAMIETLEALGSHFAQIIVLTPNPALASRFANSIHVVPGPGGVPLWPNSQEVG